MKAIILSAKTSIGRPSLRRGFLLMPLLLSCFALAPMAQAVGPDTDGSIPGSNNGEGIGVLVSRTTGIWNTGTGFEALNHLTAGNQNTATGLRALFSDTNGGFNTATGVYSLFSNTSGFFNSATGAYSLAHNTDGIQNTANGYSALYFNTGDANTATGFGALYHNTTGFSNTANGYLALFSNTIGDSNTAVGQAALYYDTIGGFNTGIGYFALLSNTTLGANTAVGAYALENATGFGNTALGAYAGSSLTAGHNNIDIGYSVFGVAGESDTIRIGNSNISATYINGISGQTAALGAAVFVASNGKLGTLTSSARFKEGIKPMDKASEALLALKPVTFRYKKEIDPACTSQFGLVAEEVEKVNPDLVVRDKEGKPYSVRYDQVNAMMLNEFLKEHKKVEAQQATIAELKSTVAQQQKGMEAKLAEQETRIEALTSGLQKVSAQVEMTRLAPQMVVNSP
jgi:hypothetical protein